LPTWPTASATCASHWRESVKAIDTFHQLRASVWAGVSLRSLAIVLGADAPEEVAVLHGWADAHTPDVSMFPRFEVVRFANEAIQRALAGLDRAEQLGARDPTG
jgi:hypothetical protein